MRNISIQFHSRNNFLSLISERVRPSANKCELIWHLWYRSVHICAGWILSLHLHTTCLGRSYAPLWTNYNVYKFLFISLVVWIHCIYKSVKYSIRSSRFFEQFRQCCVYTSCNVRPNFSINMFCLPFFLY